jgi:ACS family hexuronate transporter-like MFS transporter
MAEAAFVAWWSVANMLTALAGGFASLAAYRSLLGLGEPGHYAVSAKVVGQWFPPREKGIAAGMYTMGGTLGAALAAPLVAWLTLQFGWRSAFVVTGAAGLVCAMVWWVCYRNPDSHPWVGEDEANLLRAQGLLEPHAAKTPPPPLREIVRWRPVWLILAARMLTDPVWYFYLVWFAKYLQDVRQMTLGQVGSTLWVVFVAADVGCLGAGVLSGQLIRRGLSAPRARLIVIGGTATVLAGSFLIPWTSGIAAPLGLASLFAGCVMMFLTSCVTLPLDLFPRTALGSVQGLIGMGGSIGGFVSTGLIGWLLTEYKTYDAVFVAMSVLHPLTAVLLWSLLPGALASLPPRPESAA